MNGEVHGIIASFTSIIQFSFRNSNMGQLQAVFRHLKNQTFYFEHMISVPIKLNKIEAVKSLPVSKNVKEAQRFLCFSAHFGNSIQESYCLNMV